MVKTNKGVFITLEQSDIVVVTPYGNVLKFTSNKKKEMFLKRVEQRMSQVKNYSTKVAQLIGVGVDFTSTYQNEIFLKVYEEMLYK